MKPALLPLVRDVALLAPRLLGAALRVAVGNRIAGADAQLARFTRPAFIGAALGVDPRCIVGARIETVHSGTATRSRLLIDYADGKADGKADGTADAEAAGTAAASAALPGSAAVDTRDAAPGPASLFVKSRPPDFGSALFGVLLDLGANEVGFYRQLRGEVAVRAPAVVHCEGDSRDYAMLIEDLTDSGAEFRDLSSKCTLDEAMQVMTTLARLHAPFWQSARFRGDLAWVKRLETNRDRRLLDVLRRLSVPISFEKYGDVLPDEIRAVVPHLLDHYMALEAAWAEEPRTLIHGDAHFGNMYFQDGEAGLLDWQVMQYGQGMRDVGYFLVNSVSEALRLDNQEALIRHYLAALAGAGVQLDFETAWRQYRLQSVYAWIAAVVTAPSNFQPDEIVRAGLSRASKAVVDLDAIALVRAL